MANTSLLVPKQIEKKIYFVRNHRVLLDADMDTFVRLREMISSHADLARKINAMEKKYDHQFKVVFDAIRQLMLPPDKPKRVIGFQTKE